MFRSLIGLSLTMAFGASNPPQKPPKPEVAAESMKSGSTQKSPVEKISWIKEIGTAYGSAKSVQMVVEKSVKSFFSSKPSRSKGTLVLKKNNFRLDLKGDEDSVVVVNNGNVKVLSYPPKESGFKTTVLETSFNKKGQGDVQELFSSLLTGKNIEKQFLVKSTEKKDKQIWFKLKPKKEIPDLVEVLLKVDAANFHIEEIAMWDELKNETRYLIDEIQFNKKVEDSLFVVKNPKDAIVEKL